MKGNLSSADYEIMHGSDMVARISRTGKAIVYKEKFLPYDLYLEERQDIDDLVNNLLNFYQS